MPTRRKHSQEFREGALAQAAKVGTKRDQSDLEQSLAAENARLKRKLVEQAEGY